MTIVVQARALLEHTTEDLWEILTGNFTLRFDDGDIETNYKEVIYSSYVWDILRRFKQAPMLKSYHVSEVTKGKRLSNGTHLDLIGRVLWPTYDVVSQGLTEEAKRDLRYEFAEMSYRITNRLYNASYRMEEHVTSLDLMDFIQVLQQPEMIQAYNELKPTYSSIEGFYKVIKETLHGQALVNNPLAGLARSGLVSIAQLNQCLGPRGFITDIDSMQFPEPVLRGYVEGIGDAYGSLVESRSAAKSLTFSKSPLQKTEYFSRRVQLVSMGVENLHHEDCGTKRYLRWTVQAKDTSPDGDGWGGDLKHLVGKYYLDEESGQLKEIGPKDEHLVGKTLLLRSVLHCAHIDPMGVCATCFGRMADSVPRFSNLGHMCSTSLTQQSSQSVLSTKHLDNNASVESIRLAEDEKAFLKVAPGGNSYMFADALKGKKVKLVIPGKRATNLTDVFAVEDVKSLAISRVSELIEVGINVNDGKNPIYEATVQVTAGKRRSSMTHELLEHVRKVRWETDQNGNYIIDMAGFSFANPIFALPMQHINMADHSQEIASMLESSVDEAMERDKDVHPDALLGDFFKLVNSRLDVSLPILEVTMYAAMIVSAQYYDYSLPKPWTKSGMGVMRNTMKYRSLSSWMAFERHQEVLTSPVSFILKNRVEHPMDTILMPREVIQAGARTR